MTNIFNEIISMAFDASILIVAVIAVRLALKKMPKYFRKILWGLVGIRLLIPYSFKSIFSLMPQISHTQTQAVAQQASSQIIQSSSYSFLTYIPYLWAGVGALLLVYGAISFIMLKMKIGDAVLEKDNIYLSEKVDSPFVCGFLKPKIYFPYNVDEETRECILQHERLHIKYGDHILKALGFILVCIYWFNPLVWVSYFLFCKDIELACDEGVIKDYTDENRRKYASAILEVGVNKARLSACPVAFGEVGIKERVTSAVKYRRVTKAFACLCVVICVAIAVCFMTEPADDNDLKATEPQKKAEEIIQEPVTEVTTEAVTENVTETPKEVAEEVTKEPTKASVTKKPAKTQTTKAETTFPFFDIEPPEYHYDKYGNIIDSSSQKEPDTTTAEMNAIINKWGGSGNVSYDEEEVYNSPYGDNSYQTPTTKPNNGVVYPEVPPLFY